jgi:alpha-D-xyloside xylohydrolase
MKQHTLRSLTAAAIVSLAVVPSARAQWTPLNPVVDVRAQPTGALITLKTGYLRLQVCTESIVRVVYSLDADPPVRPDFIVTKTVWPHVDFALQTQDPESVVLKTSRLTVKVSRANSALVFLDEAGKLLAQEDARSLTPVEVNGEKTLHSERFVNMWATQEAFYGLGQHQGGVWNYRGESVDISQDNTNISVPFVLSSNGYGLFFNNGSRSRFNNRFVHAFYYSSEVSDALDYYFIYGPDFDTLIGAYRDLTGPVPLFGKWAYGFWQCKNKYETQEQILNVAHQYREKHIPVDNIVQDWFWWVTMGDPVFDAKRYPDPKGMLDDLHQSHFHLMISVWPFFRPSPDGHPESPDPVYQEMDKRGFFVAKMIVPSFHPVGQGLYDAFDPEARAYYWNLMNNALFKIGADAWWLDTTEPETSARETNVLVTGQTALGSGARYVNEYPLMTTTGVYEGQRKASDQKRVFILSRSAFAGSQRNSVATWSGDVDPNWQTFRRQIPAGLNYSVSGLPYWTTDIGGFVAASPSDPAYRELFVRWFQFGTFCPIFRVHGTRVHPNENELWSYGPEAQKVLVNFDRLRYRLLPYIYSVAWKVTSEGYTMMRPLVMDFRTDVRAQNVGDQFLFGPALLVNPVTEPAATARPLYLPNAKWYDFWTGEAVDGGRAVSPPTSLERIPLYVRAGSIVPLGPDLEYSTEKPADPIELRVYRGADGAFTLYEDENDNYAYEKGVRATIPLAWDETRQTLTIGNRSGQFPGMLATRTFHVVFVRATQGVGVAPSETADKVVRYSGQQVVVVP